MESIYKRGGRTIFAFRRKASSITLRSQACNFSSENRHQEDRLSAFPPIPNETKPFPLSADQCQFKELRINAVIQINQLSDLLLSGSLQTRTKLLDGILYLGKRSPGRHSHVNSIFLCTEVRRRARALTRTNKGPSSLSSIMRFTVINQSLSHRKGAGRGFANEQRIIQKRKQIPDKSGRSVR